MKISLAPLFLILICCSSKLSDTPIVIHSALIQTNGNTLEKRVLTPAGYTRVKCDSLSFTHFLRNLKMKPDSCPVKLYNGAIKQSDVHAAIFDIDCGTQDLQQCADACIRLRAEYLWQTNQTEKIHFNLTNGFRMDYIKWRDGNRLKVTNNETYWVKTAERSSSRETFRNYLNKVFTYAGTLSLEKELKPVSLNDLQPGDIFIVGGSPGHAAMVADVAMDSTGKKIFLLAQSYMPAQDIHIIKNPNDASLSPWFCLKEGETLKTFEWTFHHYTLGRFE